MRSTHAKQSAAPKRVPVSARPLPEPLAVRVPAAAHLLSMSERSVWYLIAKGKLAVVRVGAITLITTASIRALLGSPGDAA